MEGGFAFVPDLLPVDASETLHTPLVVEALADATLEIGRLDGRAADFPAAEVLIAPFMRREAVLSSRIEGTQTTYNDLVLYEAATELQRQEDGETREVSNYVAALRYGLERAADVSVSKWLICEIHKILMEGTAEGPRSGSFRTDQVHIAPRGIGIRDARFVPPPALHVPALFDNLVEYIQRGTDLPLLMRLAVIHYQFETIHPFYDGNGRIGRLVMPLLLCHIGMLSRPMLYLSAYFERRRAEYTDHLFNVSTDGRWSDWLLFFLRGVAAEARDSRERMRQLQELRATYWTRVLSARNAAALLMLIDALIELPVMTNARAQSILGQSLQSSSAAVDKLVSEGILTALPRPGRTQFFVSQQIFSIVDRAEAVPELI
jgi:Fic family protein